jgi:addiction module HigA family antidote
MLLEEFLAPAGTSQRAFAKRIGWTGAKLNELINGKRGITADSALDLADELGTSPELWMNLQMQFDLRRARTRRRRAS